jgi:hypothetical protein
MHRWEFFPKPDGKWYWQYRGADGVSSKCTGSFDSFDACLNDARRHGALQSWNDLGGLPEGQYPLR